MNGKELSVTSPPWPQMVFALSEYSLASSKFPDAVSRFPKLSYIEETITKVKMRDRELRKISSFQGVAFA